MKKYILNSRTLFAFLILSNAPNTIYCTANSEKPSQPAAQQQDDDEDGKVIVANVANMLQGIGILSTDPYNPAVAGPVFVQIGMSFINILTQVFKGMHIRGDITHEQVEAYFKNLPEETKLELYAMLVAYADAMRMKRITEPRDL